MARLDIRACEQPFSQDLQSSTSCFQCPYHLPFLIKSCICNLCRDAPLSIVFQELSLSQVKFDADPIVIKIAICLNYVPNCISYGLSHPED